MALNPSELDFFWPDVLGVVFKPPSGSINCFFFCVVKMKILINVLYFC